MQSCIATITREQAEYLKERFETEDAGEGLSTLLMAAAGVYMLGEIFGIS